MGLTQEKVPAGEAGTAPSQDVSHIVQADKYLCAGTVASARASPNRLSNNR